VPPLCVPIQGGRAINSPIANISGDDFGDNISIRNREYCELTVQYYAWKNESADYYGFCHYRRFFCFDESVKYPYIALGKPTAKQYGSYLGTRESIEMLCSEFDAIVPRSEDMGIMVREHYSVSKFHHAEDLELFIRIIREKAPQLLPFAEDYLSQTRQYFCNMFIMRKELFNEYCEFLFPLLEEFDKRKTMHGSFQDDRTDGYLGERFLGIFIFYIQNRGDRIKELSRIDIDCTVKKRMLYRLFPPQSKRRKQIKKIVSVCVKALLKCYNKVAIGVTNKV
jgi:hypothetical protein